MSRNERWSDRKEIKRNLKHTESAGCGAGPVLFTENGNHYCDDSESHISVIGKTGKGKTQCGSLPFSREVINKGESLILMDPKKEGYNNLRHYIPDNYQIFCLDFRKPASSPDRWNPLSTPFRLFKSDSIEDNDVASEMVSELWSAVYPEETHGEKFWSNAAANYAKGLTYALFEKADEKYINLGSVSVMMDESEIKFAAGNLVSVLHDMLPAGSLAKSNLATYATAPHETRGSIHSVASAGLEIFSRSRGLMKMLGNDTLNILELDINRPFAIFIVLPDETSAYDSLSGLFVSQVTQYLIRKAQELPGGRLPIRVNVVLEELGSVGKSIPNLPNLMVAGRSRGIRLMLVLQSNEQLVDVYGKSKAKTINSCVGITMAFSTNCWETLTEWSNRCGEKTKELNGVVSKEPLITAAQLASLPTRTMLVMLENGVKFVSPMPLYNEMYDSSCCNIPDDKKTVHFVDTVTEPFSFNNFIKNMKKEQMKENSKFFPLKPVEPEPVGKGKHTVIDHGLLGFDLDGLMERIDKQIAELDAEEAKRKKDTPGYDVIITKSKDTVALAHLLVEEKKSLNFETAIKMARDLPLIINYQHRLQAECTLMEAKKIGCEGTVETAENE